MQHLVQQQVKFSLVRNGAGGGGGGVLYLMDRESAQYLLGGKIVVWYCDTAKAIKSEMTAARVLAVSL